MPNTTLSTSDKQDIENAMRGLAGSAAKAEAEQLASFYHVDVSRIYSVSKSVRPARKRRADIGKRKHKILEDEALRFATELVVNQKVSPELALETMQANSDRFGEVDINLGTFRRYLREEGLSRVQARKNRMIFRSFEADFPGQIFQLDMSGVKERWVDVRTRAIHKVSVLEVSKNHANRRLDRVPLWKFGLKDDKERYMFMRFVACPKPNTKYVVDFLREAFAEMGLPYFLYSDNDSVISNKRTQRGAAILDKAFANSGGFKMIQHLPGQPQATGKVERSHQIVEEYEKLIGVRADFGNQPHMDALNRFAMWICNRYNNRVCSATGRVPKLGFRATTNPKRIVDADLFNAAFLARDLECRVRADVTIEVDGIRYQLSRSASDPFNLMAEAGQKLSVYWLDEEDYFACVTPAGEEYIVDKVLARTDGAFEYKTLPETRSQKNRKSLKASQDERRKAVKEEQKQTDEPVIKVPGIDTAIPERITGNVTDFPVKTETGDIAAIHEATHHIANPDAYSGRALDSFDALDLLQRQGKAPLEPGQELSEVKAWLREVYEGVEFISETELFTAFEERNAAPAVKLAAVK